MVHRDIKLENLLMAQKSELSLIKISDFGLSKKKDTSLLKSFVGTECYLAPEMIRNVINARDDPYTEKVGCFQIRYSLFQGFVFDSL